MYLLACLIALTSGNRFCIDDNNLFFVPSCLVHVQSRDWRMETQKASGDITHHVCLMVYLCYQDNFF